MTSTTLTKKTFTPSTTKRKTNLRSSPLANLAAGGLGGLASLVVGHPFDTVKVRLQSGGAGGNTMIYSSAVDCLARTVKSEGPRALYKGMAGLALTSVPRFALLFYTNTIGRSFVRNDSQELTVRQIIVGGVFSQLIVSPIMVTPLERIKVMMQVHPRRHPSQLSCLYHILRTEGWSGLSKGTLLTLARDLPSFCTYFMVYEQLRVAALHSRDLVPHSREELDLPTTATIGALSGMAAWSVALPLDCLKNRYQLLQPNPPVGWWREGGVAGLYRGVGVVLARAAPANAATFIVYEWALRWMENIETYHYFDCYRAKI